MPNVLESLASGIVTTEFNSDTGIATVANVSGWLYENLGQVNTKLLRNVISTTKKEDGWSKLSRVGTLITNHSSFDSRNYGYSRLSDLIQATGMFTLKRDNNNHFVVKKSENRT